MSPTGKIFLIIIMVVIFGSSILEMLIASIFGAVSVFTDSDYDSYDYTYDYEVSETKLILSGKEGKETFSYEFTKKDS